MAQNLPKTDGMIMDWVLRSEGDQNVTMQHDNLPSEQSFSRWRAIWIVGVPLVAIVMLVILNMEMTQIHENWYM